MFSFNKSQTNSPIESTGKGRASVDTRPFPFPLLNPGQSSSPMQKRKDTPMASNHRYEPVYASYPKSSSTPTRKITGKSSQIASDRFFPGQATYAFLPPKERLYGNNYDHSQAATNGKFCLDLFLSHKF